MSARHGFGVAGPAAAASASEARTPAQPAPRAVTRGERSPERAGGQAAKVDWLHATFPEPSLSRDGFLQFLGCLFGRPVGAIEGRGLHGFASGAKLQAYVNGAMVDIGMLAWGGESQRGRWLFQLTGQGCGLLKDWQSLHEFLEGLDAKLTRLDLCVDFLDGEYTVDDAVQMHRDGGFNGSGRPPSTSVAGDWLDNERGRTLYVGRAVNGKMLRVYEKGKQLGDHDSPWVRFEVQYGAKDREIPLDALIERDAFFVGSYPALHDMLEAAAQSIPTTQTQTKVSLAHLLHHARRCYGKVFDVVSRLSGASNTDLIEEVRIVGLPRRLNASGVVSGLSWSQLMDQVRRM